MTARGEHLIASQLLAAVARHRQTRLASQRFGTHKATKRATASKTCPSARHPFKFIVSALLFLWAFKIVKNCYSQVPESLNSSANKMRTIYCQDEWKNDLEFFDPPSMVGGGGVVSSLVLLDFVTLNEFYACSLT